MNRGEPIRVLHLRDSPWVDGPGRTILETAAHMDRSRIDYQVGVLVAAADGSHPLARALRERGLPVHEIPDDGSSVRALAASVNALADRLDIDILHASEFRTALVALLCRRQRALGRVRTVHGWITNDLRGWVKSWIDRLLLRRFDRVIVVSQATRRRVPRLLLPDARTRVLHNALVGGALRPAADAGTVRAGGATTLLNVGRLSPEKGQDLLLRAVAALSPKHPGLRLVIAGKGPLEDELRRTAAALGIGERVEFAGYVTDMAPLYARADAVVQSSFTEGLPNVILEAAQAGLPIVATDVGGTSEVIEHGISGWIVPPRRLDALVAGLEAFLGRRDTFAAMAVAARERIAAGFSYAARTAAQSELYAEVAGRAGRPARGS